jgi:hypothetical protein
MSNSNQKNIYLLHHITVICEHDEDLKLIGAFSTRGKALEAITRLSSQSGFKGSSKLHREYGDESGFYISEVELDHLDWQGGFATPWIK